MKRILSSLSAITALLFAPLLLAAEPTIEKRELAGVVNYSRMEASGGFAGSLVGFGGATEPSAIAGLRGEGYASVINLRLADEEGMDIAASQQAADAAGIKYLHLPVNVENLVPGSIETVLAAIGDPSNQPVYIHCNSATRVGAMWMIGRVLNDNWSMDVASRETLQIAKSPEEAIAFAQAYLATRN